MNQMTRSRLAALLIISVVAFSDGIALADTASDYETIFGAEAKKVAASETKTDDTAFAAKLLKASEEMPDSPTLQILLYEKACQFGSASPAGCETALEALGLLEKAAPDKKDQWRQWKFDIVKLRYDKSLGSAKKAAGKPYMEMLEILADTHMSEGKGAEAEKLYSHAIMVARYIKSDRAETILAKSKRANAIAAQQVKLSSLQTRLTTNPKDTTIREELVLFYVVELDKPAEAVKLLTDGLDEATRTYVPLAAKKLNGLDEAICLELGDWYYLKLSKEASAIGKPVVLRRSDGYYRQFLEFHKAKDAQSYRVKTALKSIEKELSKLDLGETLIVESNTTDNSTKHQTEALPRQADELDATEEEPGVSRVLAVLNRMPKSLLPDSKDGWDKLTMPKVNEWLAKYSKKKPFRGQLAFKSCAVRHIKGNTYSTSVVFRTVPDAEFTFRKQTIWLRLVADNLYISRYGGIIGQILPSNTRYAGAWQTTRKYSTNQAEAKKWQEKPIGKRFDIAGRMVSASLQPIRRSRGEKAVDYLCLVRVKMFTISEHKERRTVAKKPSVKLASDKAESRVRFAKTYLSSGLKEKAAAILMEVLEKYPNTKAAAEAKKLLRDMK